MGAKRDVTYKASDLWILSLRLGPKLSNDQIVALPPEIIDAINQPPPSNEEVAKVLAWGANEIKRLSTIVRTSMARLHAKKGPATTG